MRGNDNRRIESKSTDKRQEAPGAQVSAEREVASPTGAVLNSQRY